MVNETVNYIMRECSKCVQKKHKNIYEIRKGNRFGTVQTNGIQPTKQMLHLRARRKRKESLRFGIVKRVIHFRAEAPIWQSIIDEKNVYQIANEGDSCTYRYYCSWHRSEEPAKWSLVRLKINAEEQMTSRQKQTRPN